MSGEGKIMFEGIFQKIGKKIGILNFSRNREHMLSDISKSCEDYEESDIIFRLRMRHEVHRVPSGRENAIKIKDGETSYCIWSDYFSGICTLNLQTEEENVLVPKPKQDCEEYWNYLCAGVCVDTKIYYAIIVDMDDGLQVGCECNMKIYSINIDGTENIYIGDVEQGVAISHYYEDRLYIQMNDAEGFPGGYEYDLQTKVVKNIFSDVFMLHHFNTENYVFALQSEAIKFKIPSRLMAYDTSAEKIYILSEKSVNGATLKNERLYYMEYDEDTKLNTVYSQTFYGEGKMKHGTSFPDYIDVTGNKIRFTQENTIEIAENYIIYYNVSMSVNEENQYCKYYFTTGQILVNKSLEHLLETDVS